ncbi:ethanolamine utilization protein EutJ, partial [Acinetobacter baumannii]|nr:ethanolamine utilization protein EutJ [Acinetobacter baumannii]
AELEERLGTELINAATAIPPGILVKNAKGFVSVVEGAGFEVTNIVDEPTAAATVIGIKDGAVVDIGG